MADGRSDLNTKHAAASEKEGLEIFEIQRSSKFRDQITEWESKEILTNEDNNTSWQCDQVGHFCKELKVFVNLLNVFNIGSNY